MTKDSFLPREDEVLKIRAFLKLDGSDGISKNIAALWKWEQLDEYYNTIKQPKDGHTYEEKALAFYPKDTQKLNGKWLPTWRAIRKMKVLESYRRRLMGRTLGNMSYASKIALDSSKPPVWLGSIITKEAQFDNKSQYISGVGQAENKRVRQLDKIKTLSPTQRKQNTIEARRLYGGRKRRKGN